MLENTGPVDRSNRSNHNTGDILFELFADTRVRALNGGLGISAIIESIKTAPADSLPQDVIDAAVKELVEQIRERQALKRALQSRKSERIPPFKQGSLPPVSQRHKERGERQKPGDNRAGVDSNAALPSAPTLSDLGVTKQHQKVGSDRPTPPTLRDLGISKQQFLVDDLMALRARLRRYVRRGGCGLEARIARDAHLSHRALVDFRTGCLLPRADADQLRLYLDQQGA